MINISLEVHKNVTIQFLISLLDGLDLQHGEGKALGLCLSDTLILHDSNLGHIFQILAALELAPSDYRSVESSIHPPVLAAIGLVDILTMFLAKTQAIISDESEHT